MDALKKTLKERLAELRAARPAPKKLVVADRSALDRPSVPRLSSSDVERKLAAKAKPKASNVHKGSKFVEGLGKDARTTAYEEFNRLAREIEHAPKTVGVAKPKAAGGAGAMPTRPLPPGMTPPEGGHTPMPARSMAALKEKLSARKALSATDPRLHDPIFVRSATKPELLPSE